jgi:branched-chain amino acid transport system substrate-binding protein
MKKITITTIIIVLIISGISYKTIKKEQGIETIKIGVLTPLTGSISEYGNNVKQGIELATLEINKNGGIDNKKIELIFEDSKCDPTQAVNSFNKLVDVDGVGAVLGTVCSGETLAISPIANDKKVVVISAAASSPKITNAGDYIFRVYPSDDYESGVAAETVYNRLKKTKVSVLYLNNDYGVALRDSFRKKFESLGGRVLGEEGYLQESKDFRTQLLKIKSQKPDAVYMISYPVDGGLAIKQAKELGIEVVFLGTSGLKANDFISSGGKSTEGFILASIAESSSTKEDIFTKSYEEMFGRKPGLVSDMAYDSMYILRKAFVGTKNIEEVKNNLYKIKGFDGASGEINFDLNGDITNIKYSLFTVKNGQFILLK